MLRHSRLLLIMYIAVFLIQCGNQQSQDTVTLRVPVTVEEVTRGDIASYISLTGTLLPAEEMPIVTEVAGFISFANTTLKRGDSVQKGMLIARLENEDYVLNLRLESKRLAKEHAIKDYDEKKKLGEMGGIPPRDVEAAERNKIDTEISYKTALLDLEKLNIKAPMTGILTDLKSLGRGQKVAGGTEIGTVMKFDIVRCELNITNDNIDKIKLNQEVVVTNFAYEGEPFTGYITKISPTIDPVSRTFQVEVEIDNKDFKLRPGMFVKADIVVSKRSGVVRVPKHLILTRNRKSVVFIVEEQVAKMKEVTVGLQDAEYAEILEGIAAGDRLVVQGYETLKDNTKVRVSR